jgi:hypothetical protein
MQQRAEELEAGAAKLRRLIGRLEVPTWEQWQAELRRIAQADAEAVIKMLSPKIADELLPWEF